MTINLSWGYSDGSSEAPYYLMFNCYRYPRTSRERGNLSNPVIRIILPGVRLTRGTAHRYSEDAPMMENVQQALGTIKPAFDPGNMDNQSIGEVLSNVEKAVADGNKRFQKDAFGQISSKLGRLELLTTEAGFLGSSKRKYNFSWNLKSTANNANTNIAKNIGEHFERFSMPVVGGFAEEGDIAQASRMRPPNVWTISAVNEFGENEAEATRLWLGRPKVCVLLNVMHALDTQSFIAGVGGPFSYFLGANFVELENVFNYNNDIVSRSEYFNALGGG